jgi:hypothetical protein
MLQRRQSAAAHCEVRSSKYANPQFRDGHDTHHDALGWCPNKRAVCLGGDEERRIR